jgi:hypothetical protein
MGQENRPAPQSPVQALQERCSRTLCYPCAEQFAFNRAVFEFRCHELPHVAGVVSFRGLEPRWPCSEAYQIEVCFESDPLLATLPRFSKAGSLAHLLAALRGYQLLLQFYSQPFAVTPGMLTYSERRDCLRVWLHEDLLVNEPVARTS